MKLISIILTSFLLFGCASKPVPIVPKFPVAPNQLQEECPPLKSLDKEPKLSDVAKIVTENYTQYHECSIKVRAWTEWYRSQKIIFEETK